MASYTNTVRGALLALAQKLESEAALEGSEDRAGEWRNISLKIQSAGDVAVLLRRLSDWMNVGDAEVFLQAALEAAALSGRVPAEDPDDAMLLEIWAGNALQGLLSRSTPHLSTERAAIDALDYAEALLDVYHQRRNSAAKAKGRAA